MGNIYKFPTGERVEEEIVDPSKLIDETPRDELIATAASVIADLKMRFTEDGLRAMQDPEYKELEGLREKLVSKLSDEELVEAHAQMQEILHANEQPEGA